MVDDAKIVKDPPLDSFTTVARVAALTSTAPPSCTRWSGALLALCDRLRPALKRYLSTRAQADAVDDSIVVTIDRDSGALAAENASAIAAQNAALRNLDAEFRADARAEGQAGRALAAILNAVKVAMQMSGVTGRRLARCGQRGSRGCVRLSERTGGSASRTRSRHGRSWPEGRPGDPSGVGCGLGRRSLLSLLRASWVAWGLGFQERKCRWGPLSATV